MKKILAVVKRNCLLFLRNKSTVFFSFLSSLILISLYFLFIAKLYSQGFNEAGGVMLSTKQINCAIYIQMIVSVLVLNSVSLSMGMFWIMAGDLENRKTDALLLTKLTPFQLMVSYLISAVLVSFVINLITWIVGLIIIGLATSCWIAFGTVMAVVGVLFITTIISCCIVLLITVIVKSSTAIGVINGIIGTFLGFLCGIYMPYTNLGKTAVYIGSTLPFTHLTIWLKKIVLTDVFAQFGMSSNVSTTMQKLWFSAGNIGFCGLELPLWAMILYSAVIGLICLIVAVLIMKNIYKRNLVHKKFKPKQN